jgi:hypothetical protein
LQALPLVSRPSFPARISLRNTHGQATIDALENLSKGSSPAYIGCFAAAYPTGVSEGGVITIAEIITDGRFGAETGTFAQIQRLTRNVTKRRISAMCRTVWKHLVGDEVNSDHAPLAKPTRL